MNPAFDRSDGDVESLRNFGVVQILQVVEHEHCAMIVGQSRERGTHLLCAPGCDGSIFGPGAVGDRLANVVQRARERALATAPPSAPPGTFDFDAV